MATSSDSDIKSTSTLDDPYSLASLFKDEMFINIISPFVQVASQDSLTTISQEFRTVSLMNDIEEASVGDDDLPRVIRETVDVLKVATVSSGAVLYMVNESSKEIVLVSRRETNTKISWKIQPGTTVAAYVAYSKEPVVTENSLGDWRFPDGIGWNEINAGSVLCIPILADEDECVGVIELYRNPEDQPYGKVEEQMTAAVVSWMGAAIRNNRERGILLKKQILDEYFLETINSYFQKQTAVEQALSQIVLFAKVLLDAEKSLFYVVDDDGMFADVYGEKNGVYVKTTRVKLLTGRSVASHVARTRKMVNIPDIKADTRFDDIVSDEPRKIIRSVICVPIMNEDKVLGVLQFMNKVSDISFTKFDEKLLESFSLYWIIALNFAKSLKQSQDVEKRLDLTENMLIYFITPDFTCLERLQSRKEVPDNFQSFAWYPSNKEDSLATYAARMLAEVCENWFANYRQICEFVLCVERAYRHLPRHNFEHGVNVMHCMYSIIKRNEARFTEIEKVSLLIAALCADVDHTGRTNTFLKQSSHPLSHLYNESYMENHHYYTTMLIIRACKLFVELPNEISEKVNKEVHDAIMATDLSFYFRVREKAWSVIKNGAIDWQNPLHKMYIKSIMVIASTFCGYCKPIPVSRHVVDKMFEEFYLQAEEEKNLGITLSSIMDIDNKQSIPENQLQFINLVYLPCLKLLQEIIPNIDDMVEMCLAVQRYWQEIVDTKNQKVWRPEESYVKN